jgi:hypothetical protein
MLRYLLFLLRLLKPLGNATANGIKFYSTAELLELAKDRAWLVKVMNPSRDPARMSGVLVSMYFIFKY